MKSNNLICSILVLIPLFLPSNLYSQNKTKLEQLLNMSSVTALDTLEKKFVSKGIKDVCSYLKNDDEDKFSEVIAKSKNVSEIIPNVMKIYDIDMVGLATEYFKRTNEKASFKSRYSMLESAHFRIFYPQNFSGDEITFIVRESEIVFDSLEKVFKPDSLKKANFDILYTYSDWQKNGFTERTGDIISANKKFQIVLVNSVEEMNKISGNNSNHQIAVTDFVSAFKDNKYVVTMLSVVAYKSPISLIEIIHEITHSYIYTVFSKPQIIQDYTDVHPEVTKNGKIPEMVFLNAFSRTSMLTIEGVAVWAGFNFSPYQRCGFLPDSRHIINSPESAVKLIDLLSGNIDLSIFGALFGKANSAVGNFFLSSGSFMGFISDNWTSDQIKKIFEGSGEVITEKEIKDITGKTVDSVEKEWYEWMK